MTQQAVFDLARPNPIARGCNHVVVTADEAQTAIRPLVANIAGEQPAVHELRLCGFGLVPVPKKHDGVGTAHSDIPMLAVVQPPPRIVDDGDVMAGNRPTHRTGNGLLKRTAAGHHHIAFGLTVELVDCDAEARAPPFEQLTAERLAAAGDAAQTQPPTLLGLRDIAHHLERCRGYEGIAYFEILQQLESGFGIEL